MKSDCILLNEQNIHKYYHRNSKQLKKTHTLCGLNRGICFETAEQQTIAMEGGGSSNHK